MHKRRKGPWPPKVAPLAGPYKLTANEGELLQIPRLACSQTQAIRAGATSPPPSLPPVLVLLAAKVAV